MALHAQPQLGGASCQSVQVESAMLARLRYKQTVCLLSAVAPAQVVVTRL
jgi:hypothetical protein